MKMLPMVIVPQLAYQSCLSTSDGETGDTSMIGFLNNKMAAACAFYQNPIKIH